MSDHNHLLRKSPSTGPKSPNVWGLYEAPTGSIQYIVACPDTGSAAIIDAVLNFDPKSAATSTESAERLLEIVSKENLKLERILDTHPHADHMMAAHWLKEKTGKPNAIGSKVKDIAEIWRGLYNLPDGLECEKYFDEFFDDGDSFQLGNLNFDVRLSPGHTLGSISYIVGDAGLVHDTLMMPDSGSSRADFPGGSAEDLWKSIQTILALDDDTRLFIGHDYGKGGREPAWEATVADHKRDNIHVKDGTSKQDFIETRTERDETLSLPDRMLQALQVNLRGGALPDEESDSERYLKIPLNRF